MRQYSKESQGLESTVTGSDMYGSEGNEENMSEYSGSSSSSSSSAYSDEQEYTWFQRTFKRGGLVNGKPFGFFIGLTIVINSIVIGLETDLACHSSNTCRQPDDYWVWIILENLFLGVFVVEMALKIYALKFKGYWADPWNKFDFVLVMISVVDNWIMGVMLNQKSGFRIIQVLRVLRVFRLVRLVKLLRQFKELYLLVNGMVEAAKTLVWVGMLLIVILYVSGIIFTILIGQNENHNIEYNGAWSKEDYWGTVPKSMFTLFQVMTGDSWGSSIARPLIREYPGYTIFFLVFIFLIAFGLMNIVLGVICENAIYAASKNLDNLQKILVKRQQMVIDSITLIFEAADTDGSGELSRDEFDEALAKRSVMQKLELIDIPPGDLRMLFDLLDSDASGQITIEEFRKGCLKLQGTAKSREMIKLAVYVSTYNKNLDDMRNAMLEQNNTLKTIYHRLYDLEKTYFRPHMKKKKKGDKEKSPDKKREEEKKPNRRGSAGCVSILGAVAAAGKHAAMRRASMEGNDPKLLPDEQKKGKRGSIMQGMASLFTKNGNDEPNEADRNSINQINKFIRKKSEANLAK